MGDSGLFAERFGARRIIHEGDRNAAPGAEIVVKGREAQTAEPGFTIIPVPGHTLGHCVLLYRDTYLFTGDHLEWDLDERALAAYRNFCWYDWKEQTRSMERLLDYSFEWILPGHGNPVRLPPEEMRSGLVKLIEKMKVEG